MAAEQKVQAQQAHFVPCAMMAALTARLKVLEPQADRVQAQLRVFLKYGPRGERVVHGLHDLDAGRLAGCG